MAAMAVARRSILSPAARGGGRLWHAPLPSRNRFAVHGAESRVPTILDARGGGRWSPSAWASAQFSSGKPDEEAMWRALLDIRMFAVRVDKHSLRQEQANAVFASQQLEMLKLVKKITNTEKGFRPFGILFCSSLFLITWAFFYMGSGNALDMLDEFLATRVNKIVTDPETQRSIQSSAVLFSDTVARRYNPWHRFNSWITGEVEQIPELATTEVSRDTFLALFIILLLHVNYKFGSTCDELMGNLEMIGMKDQAKNFAILQLLENMGYVETMDTFNKQRGYAKTYWPSKGALLDSTSGQFERKVRKALSAFVKEKQAAST